jgi:WD40 repeat protein/tRNA A-37 threonylcarbamoyl transferase component Bud32
MHQAENLLFGIFAVQLRKVTPAQLMQVAGDWAADPTDHLPERLLSSGSLSKADHDVLVALVHEAIQKYDNNPQAALDAFGGAAAVYDSYRGAITVTDSGVVHHGDTVSLAELQDADVPAVQEAPGRYTHHSEYAVGGMGRVLLVHDEHLAREVAMKELLPDSEAETVVGEEPVSPVRMSVPLIARFLQEARITGQLEHPSIVPVYELGYRADGSLYYTMKLVRGRTLSRALREAGSLDARLALLPHLVDLCQAIAYAHSCGVIHRDIKPSNVIIGDFGETVVIDWGLAVVRGKDDIHAHDIERTMKMLQLGDEEAAQRTVYGQAMGTPSYMPPEQALGQLDKIDERSDVYSLGAVLYELLTGAPPFEGKTIHTIMRRVVDSAATPVRTGTPDAPPELSAICHRCLEKNSEKRYRTAEELAGEVQRFMSGAVVHAHRYTLKEVFTRFVRRHRAAVIAGATAVLAIAAIGIYYNIQLYVSRNREQVQRVAAEDANKELRWENYAFMVASAQDHLKEHNWSTARKLLDQCPPEYRDWEWGRLLLECSPAVWQLRDFDTPEPTHGFAAKVQLSPNDRYLLLHRYFGGLRHIFDLQEGRMVYHAYVGEVMGRPQCTQWTPDSSGFTVTTGPRTVGLWRWESPSELPEQSFEVENGELVSVAFSPDGLLLAGFVAHPEPTPCELVIWDVATGTRRKQIALRPIPDMGYLYPTSEAWLREMEARQGRVLGFMPDGARVVITDTEIASIDIETEERVDIAPCTHRSAFSPQAMLVAAESPDGPLKVYSLETGEHLTTIAIELPDAYGVAIHPSGNWVITTGHMFSQWDVSTGALVYQTPHIQRSLSFSSNGNALFSLRGGGSPIVEVLDVHNPRDMVQGIPLAAAPELLPTTGYEYVDQANSVHARNHAGTHMAQAHESGMVYVWKLPDRALVQRWQADSESVYAIGLSEDGTRMVTAGKDGAAFWDVATGESIWKRQAESGHHYRSSAIAPDGKRIALGAVVTGADSGEGDNMAAVLDAATGDTLYTVAGHPGACNFVRFTPNNQWLLTGTYGSPDIIDAKSLFLWDAATGAELAGTVDSLNWVWDVDFSPDGANMLVMSLSLQPVLYNLTELREVWRVRSGDAMSGFFMPGGERIVIMRPEGFAIHATLDGRELVAYDKGGSPAYPYEPDRALFVAESATTATKLFAADWTVVDREDEFEQGLDKVRRLVGLPGP